MPPLTYANYLDLEKLLTLQSPRSTPAEHDEMLFIIIHQTYELWFKQLLHEFENPAGFFGGRFMRQAMHSLKRTRTIMKMLVAQIDILETMTPTSFSSFREPRHRVGVSNRGVSRTRIPARIQTRGDAQIRETGFPGRGPVTEAARRTNSDRSLLRVSRDTRRADSRRPEESRPLATKCR